MAQVTRPRTAEDAVTPTPKTDAALELVGVSKCLGGVQALHNLDLQVAHGEFLTLLGPSGSGKTTTLNLIAGFLAPDTGDIRIGGQRVVDQPPERRDIGIVFQSYALFPHMTIAENVAFPLRRRGVRGAELRDRVVKALELVELQHRLEARPEQLSGGQQQRVALARALVFEPRLVLLDEPLGALDRRLRQHLQEQLRELHQQLGFTAVYVTHDQEEALWLSDRIAIMAEGELVQLGSGEDLYRRPASVFVARFLGDANTVPGEVMAATDPETCRVRLAGGAESTVRLSSPQLVAKGQAVVVVARPEALLIEEPDFGGSERLCHGRLVEQVFLGQNLQSVVMTDDGHRIVVREPGETRRDSPLTMGDTVGVAWRDTTRGVALVEKRA